jgi:ceramide glucosyltransferase
MLKEANNELIIVSDDDVFVVDNFLTEVALHFTRTNPALLNCFYRITPANFPMALEAIAVNADAWSQVLQALTLQPMDFALGAVMVLKRDLLLSLGGFEPLLEYLADDYQLGHRVAKEGGRLELFSVPVECRSDPQSATQVWKHQLRWARTIRVCRPIPYFFSISSNATLWPLLAWILGAPFGGILLLLCLLLRILSASFNYWKLTRKPAFLIGLLAPIKDLFGALIWFQSFTRNNIVWRGQKFQVNHGGKLTPTA